MHHWICTCCETIMRVWDHGVIWHCHCQLLWQPPGKAQRKHHYSASTGCLRAHGGPSPWQSFQQASSHDKKERTSGTSAGNRFCSGPGEAICRESVRAMRSNTGNTFQPCLIIMNQAHSQLIFQALESETCDGAWGYTNTSRMQFYDVWFLM